MWREVACEALESSEGRVLCCAVVVVVVVVVEGVGCSEPLAVRAANCRLQNCQLPTGRMDPVAVLAVRLEDASMAKSPA